jgi:aryl-alcohol dehydrogenase
MTSARIAVCHGPGKQFTLENARLDELQDHEVLVRVVASGICHTDLAVRDHQLPMPTPSVLGHEGAGIVEAVGSGVTSVVPGDRILMSFNSCGHCVNCDQDLPTYCYDFINFNWTGVRPDGSATLFQGDDVVHANFFGQSSFATHAIANVRNVFKVPDFAKHLSLEVMAPLGCGLMTGAGAVLNSMSVKSGRPIAIFGTGTVGNAAVMAAKIAGAYPIIAVDINDSRLALTKELGATHTFNAKEDAIAKIAELCPQGLSYAFDTTGLKSVIQDVFNIMSPKSILGMVGASDPTHMLEFNETAFMGGGRTVMGILGGDSDLHTFLPRLLQHHIDGEFPFDRLIEHFDFDEINEAIEASERGDVIKPVLKISAE